MYKFINSIVFTMLMAAVVSAQSTHKNLRQGDKDYKSGNYSLAEDNYRKAWIEKQNDKGGFNLGNSIYQQQDRYEEAIKQYEALANASKDPALKSKALYNLGNAHYQQQEFDKSIDAYKNALRLNMQDEDIRKNLMLAMQKLQQQEQQQQQQQQKDEQDKEENNEDQQQEQQQQQDQQQPQDQQEPKQQEQEQPRDLSKEEAEQLLKIIEQEEQKVQEKLRKASSSKKKPLKEW